MVAILRYLEDWDKLTRSPVTNVQDYRAGLAALQNEVQDIPDIKLNLIGGDGDAVWMEVPRLAKEAPPLLVESLLPWVILKDDPSDEPRHRDSIVLPGENDQEESETVKFDDQEDVQQSFDEYLREQWRPWSDNEQKRRRWTEACRCVCDRLHAIPRLKQTLSFRLSYLSCRDSRRLREVHRWNKLARGIDAPTVDAPPDVCVQQLAAHAKAVAGAMTLSMQL